MSWDSQFIHTSGNSKQFWQIRDAACTDLSSWWWAKKPLETCRALTVIKSVIQRCILLVMLKNTLKMRGPMNVKLYKSVAVVFLCSTPHFFFVINYPTVLLSLAFTKRDGSRGCPYFCMRHKPWNLEGEDDASFETSYITYKQRSVASQNKEILEYYYVKTLGLLT